MPSYRERREAGDFEPDKPALEAVQEAADDELPEDETPAEKPAEKPKQSGVKVTDTE